MNHETATQARVGRDILNRSPVMSRAHMHIYVIRSIGGAGVPMAARKTFELTGIHISFLGKYLFLDCPLPRPFSDLGTLGSPETEQPPG